MLCVVSWLVCFYDFRAKVRENEKYVRFQVIVFSLFQIFGKRLYLSLILSVGTTSIQFTYCHLHSKSNSGLQNES